jgi:hypothetical protein
LLRVLAYSIFRLDADERDLLLADYLPFAEVVSLPNPLPDLPIASRERDDAIFVHLTISSGADLADPIRASAEQTPFTRVKSACQFG